MKERDFYKKTSRRFFDSLNKNDFEELKQYMSEDIRFDFPGAKPISGIKKVLLFFKVLLRKYTELKFTVSEIIAENGKVCAVWTNTGIYCDGSLYENSGMTLIYFENNKISYLSDYFKDTSFTKR